MDEVKVEHKDNIMTIEGEFDIELDLTAMHVGYPPEDESIFKKSPFEIKAYGEVNLDYIRDMIEWVNRKSVSKTPVEWPRWKIIFQRLPWSDKMQKYLVLERKVVIKGEEVTIRTEVSDTVPVTKTITDDEGNIWNVVGEREAESHRDPFG